MRTLTKHLANTVPFVQCCFNKSNRHNPLGLGHSTRNEWRQCSKSGLPQYKPKQCFLSLILRYVKYIECLVQNCYNYYD